MNDCPVICWWGENLRILTDGGRVASRGLADHEDPIPSIIQAVVEECPRAVRARLIFQPPSLEIHEITCPDISRTGLRKILVRDHPALAAPDAIWTADPIRRGRNGFGTLLYIDHRSRLPALVAGLARRGLHVEGAWPLPALTEAAAPANAAGRGSLGLIAVAQRALVACVGPSGDRSVQFQEGSDFSDAVIAAVQTAQARFEDSERPPGWFALEEGSLGDALRPSMVGMKLAETTIADFLGRARSLPPGGFSDFLLPPPFYARRSVRWPSAIALGLALLFGGVGTLRLRRESHARERRQWAAALAHRLQLQQEAAASLAVQGQIDQLGQAILRAESAPQPHAEFLMTLARLTPKTAALSSVSIEAGDFVVRGLAPAGETAESPWTALQRGLTAPGLPWKMRNEPAATTESEFVLRGSFAMTPAAIAAPATVAQLQGRLAAARAMLTSAAAFDVQMPLWSRHWIVTTRFTEHLPDLELRHYALDYDHPTLRAWSDMVATVRNLCRQPGLTIDRIILTAAPDRADAFVQAAVGVTIRLRP